MKLPYGIASVVLAIILGLSFISLDPAKNRNGGFDFLPEWLLAISNTVGILFLVLAGIIAVYTVLKELYGR